MDKLTLADVIEVLCSDANTEALHAFFDEGVPDEDDEIGSDRERAVVERNRILRDAFAELKEARVQKTCSGVRLTLLSGEVLEISGRLGRAAKMSQALETSGRDASAFQSGVGACYIADDGTLYTRQDFLSLIFDPQMARELFEVLIGQHPAAFFAQEFVDRTLWGDYIRVDETLLATVQMEMRSIVLAGLEEGAPGDLDVLAEDLLRALNTFWTFPLAGSAYLRASQFLRNWLAGYDEGFWATWSLEAQIREICRWVLKMVRPSLVRA